MTWLGWLLAWLMPSFSARLEAVERRLKAIEEAVRKEVADGDQ